MTFPKLNRTFILYPDKKFQTGYFTFVDRAYSEQVAASPSKDVTAFNLDTNEQEVIEIKYTLHDIERLLKKAMENGNEVSVTYYNFPAFDTVTGYVEKMRLDTKEVSIVNISERWDIKTYDIVEVEYAN